MSSARKVVEMDRPIPQNVEAERAVLGAILLDNKALAIVRQTLESEDFFLSEHVSLFREIVELVERGTAADLLTVVDKIGNDGALESMGGAAYISSLLDGLPKISNVEFHAGIVKEKAGRRRILYAAAAIQKAAYDGDLGASLDMADANFKDLRKYLPGTARNFFDTWQEFEAAPALSFAVEGFLQNDAITGIAGLSGHAKTWLATSIGRALLLGPGKLWDLFEVPSRAAKLVYLIPESTRTAFKHRLQLMGIYDEIYSGRLLVRTLSKGPTPLLSDSSLLHAVKKAHVIIDTGVRFMGKVDESSGTDIAEGLSKDLLGLLYAEASSVMPLFHSPKSFLKEPAMTLEGMIRGSSEFGAVLATAWGIKQIDRANNTIHIQNIKPRDFNPCDPFQLCGRPFIDETGDFRLLKAPGECGSLCDEQPELNRGGGAPEAKRSAKAANLALLKGYLAANPNLTTPELREMFAKDDVKLPDSTIRSYKHELKKGPK